MCRGISNQCVLKVIRYDDHMIDLNKYLSVFLVAKASEKLVR